MKRFLLAVMALIVAGSFCACRTTRKQTAGKTPAVPVKETVAAKTEAPKAEVPAAKVETPAVKAEAPAAKVEAPAVKAEVPAAKVEAPKTEAKAEPTVLKAETPKVEAKTEFPAKYIVKTGDSLWKISSKFYGRGSSWKQIYEANKSNIKRVDFLEPGTELVIPAPGK